MNASDWRLRGEWFDVCSCKLPCPCSFAQEPTHGDCLFTLVWQVREGYFEDVRLDGLGVVALGEFAGNMWEGDPDVGMTVMLYIDAKGDTRQRAALERIFTGQVGGWPGTFGALIREVREVRYEPVEFESAEDLAYWRATIPDRVSVGARALTGPTADPSRRVQLVNAPGSEVGPGQIATWGVVSEDRAEGFAYSHEYRGGSSKHFPFDWRP
ncbi:DUF1326 domain-containing protein [Streptomyces sp. AJS327]|uniref:DUF1326 domain-containing protein n=1 Tax=Streptomyces sp. AJS327 TaxID=2545265 RepID=UPI0015E04794|nr:DUF1326 domain-containing protein [Streptomyces sp. AJS327]MBA0054168.1 DUF1326 domain-containing protein [Streptomyces sp. AJS327]